MYNPKVSHSHLEFVRNGILSNFRHDSFPLFYHIVAARSLIGLPPDANWNLKTGIDRCNQGKNQNFILFEAARVAAPAGQGQSVPVIISGPLWNF